MAMLRPQVVLSNQLFKILFIFKAVWQIAMKYVILAASVAAILYPILGAILNFKYVKYKIWGQMVMM